MKPIDQMDPHELGEMMHRAMQAADDQLPPVTRMVLVVLTEDGHPLVIGNMGRSSQVATLAHAAQYLATPMAVRGPDPSGPLELL